MDQGHSHTAPILRMSVTAPRVAHSQASYCRVSCLVPSGARGICGEQSDTGKWFPLSISFL